MKKFWPLPIVLFILFAHFYDPLVDVSQSTNKRGNTAIFRKNFGELIDQLYVKSGPYLGASEPIEDEQIVQPDGSLIFHAFPGGPKAYQERSRHRLQRLGYISDEDAWWYTKIRWSKDGSLLCGIDGATDNADWAWDFTKSAYVPSAQLSRTVKASGGLGQFVMKNGDIVNSTSHIPLHQEILKLDAALDKSNG